MSKNMDVDYFGFAYAIAVAAGGIVGYVKAGSLPSLGAGLVFGSILGYGAYRVTQNPHDIYLSLGSSLVLGGIMGVRYYNSQKFMPAGLIALLSLAMVIKLSYRGISDLVESQKHN